MKLKIAVLTGAMALVAATAFAAAGETWLGVQGGTAVPTGDFGDAVKTGFQGTLMGYYGTATNCAVGVDLGYHMWKGKDDAGGDDLSVSAIQATLQGLYNFPIGESKAKPYVKLGAGLYNVKAKLDLPAPNDFDESYSKFGFNAGGGVNFAVSPTAMVGLDARMHMIMGGEDFVNSDGDEYNPMLFTVGVNVLFGLGGK